MKIKFPNYTPNFLHCEKCNRKVFFKNEYLKWKLETERHLNNLICNQCEKHYE